MSTAGFPEDQADDAFDRLSQIPAVLVRHSVEFVAIGGWAVQAQQLNLGYVTQDVDFTPNTDHDNLQRLSAALDELQARLRTGSESFPFTHDAEFLARMSVLNLTSDHGNFDICVQPAGIDGGYEELARRAHTILLEVRGEVI